MLVLVEDEHYEDNIKHRNEFKEEGRRGHDLEGLIDDKSGEADCGNRVGPEFIPEESDKEEYFYEPVREKDERPKTLIGNEFLDAPENMSNQKAMGLVRRPAAKGRKDNPVESLWAYGDEEGANSKFAHGYGGL